MSDQMLFTLVGTVVIVGAFEVIRRWHTGHW